ncbi:Uncharacterized protein APZ42_027455 [Daphnia magna]|uniref:Uncharacterized protein n=1 Tax=Daphnia magna TaxID=35525 RepID=A0A0P5ZSD4_9CRUS|nr:Uncharacterized protein APZ42_027455 [Daphnia magna]
MDVRSFWMPWKWAFVNDILWKSLRKFSSRLECNASTATNKKKTQRDINYGANIRDCFKFTRITYCSSHAPLFIILHFFLRV